MTDDTQSSQSKLPVPGKVYAIPADTHADLDLQDDKEQVFYRNGSYDIYAFLQRYR